MVFFTPQRAVKRRLFATPMSAKRFKATPSRTYSRFNRVSSKGASTKGSLRTQVKSLQTVVNKLKPEKKYSDISLASNNITTAGSVVHVTAIAQGDTSATRTGDAIQLTDVQVAGVLIRATDAPAVTTNGTIRYALVYDKQQVADTSPTAAVVFNGANPVIALPVLDGLDRFTVIWMSPVKVLSMMSLDNDLVIPPTAPHFITHSMKLDRKVVFNGTASSDIQKNGLYFVILTDDAGNTIDFSGTARIGFTDV